jgi:hypothetical protein
MKIDRTTKILLLLVVLGLCANVLTSFFRPITVVRAADQVSCKGKLKASPFGVIYPGGYDVEISCN